MTHSKEFSGIWRGVSFVGKEAKRPLWRQAFLASPKYQHLYYGLQVVKESWEVETGEQKREEYCQ